MAKTRVGYRGNSVQGYSIPGIRFAQYSSLTSGLNDMNRKLDRLSSFATNELDKAMLEEGKKYGAENWYDWACNNWGTKWNSCHTEIIEDEKDGLTYTFDTAWDCPREVVEKLQHILDEELPFISIESWGCVHEDGQEFEQII